ncbi:LysR family transcriptional regulator [Thalassomonas actiniarum]|uniref:LysR family transcriptional regulator n=1 Tax=Thalassomonas actiniarum TaxID=485447 RepID=A0AAF0C1P6_9GAMM|nr:LysR family transcriptional regulator [Thalassomonas actiniarum]WDD99231.1 LysR family transcriptional regulator [Thalassomonas actiniarum]
MKNYNDRVVFAHVAQSGSFTAAAKALNLTKSNVSQRISRLEQEIGVRLLERTTRSISLTEAGRLYFEYCQQIIHQLAQGENKILQMLEKPMGELKITTSLTLGEQLLRPILAEFIFKFPEVKLNMFYDNQRLDLIREGFDAGIRIGPLDDSSLVAKKLGIARIAAYASPEYISAHPGRMDLLVMEANRERVYQAYGHNKNTVIKASANELSTIYEWTLAGLGIGVLPHYMIRESVKSGRLLRVLTNFPLMDGEINLVYPSRVGATPKLHAFIDFIQPRLSQQLL